MKIVTKKEFMNLPNNTLYSALTSAVFGPLRIKGDTVRTAAGEPIDWYAVTIADAVESTCAEDFMASLDYAHHTGNSIQVEFNTECRYGGTDDSEFFAVWEQQDINRLIARLNECL